MQKSPAAAPMANKARAYVVLSFMPLFFSSNIIIGRSIIEQTEPFTLAFFRWLFAAALLLALCRAQFQTIKQNFYNYWKKTLLLGFLGMWICGALVYFALKYTSAANGTLIYASSSVLIIVLEWLFYARPTSLREMTGICIAVTGVAVIVLKGDISALLLLRFNPGDVLFIVAAISWAAYSVISRSQPFSQLQTMPFLALAAIGGAITLLPFAGAEVLFLNSFPSTVEVWAAIAGLVVLSSLFPFTAYQYGVKAVGPSITGIFLYLLPVYGVGLAVLLLGEELQHFHITGFALILGGIILATAPALRYKKR